MQQLERCENCFRKLWRIDNPSASHQDNHHISTVWAKLSCTWLRRADTLAASWNWWKWVACNFARSKGLTLTSSSLWTVNSSFSILKTAKVSLSRVADSYTQDQYVGRVMKFCSYGLSTKTSASQEFHCAYLEVLPGRECSENNATICTRRYSLSSSGNGACLTEYGAPLYDTARARTVVVGIAAWTPTPKRNSPCMSGHKIEFSAVTAPKELSQQFHFIKGD